MLGCLIGNSLEVSEKKSDPFGCERSAERQSNAMTGALAGGLAGTLMGGVIGGAAREDIGIIGLEKRDFSVL